MTEKANECENCWRLFANNGSRIRHQATCGAAAKVAMFWSKVIKQPGCWGWTGHTRWDGYGRFRHQYKAVFAHRLSYEIHYGPIPEGMCVMHTCDNPICTNPKHLRLGTHLENMRDMRAKGRGRGQQRAI